jgi:sulfide dehydrogenase cytochrome subunit
LKRLLPKNDRRTHENFTPCPFRKSRRIQTLALPLLCLALSPLVQAQSAGTKEALYVKSLAATCANCHGTNGKAVDGSSVPSLAGLDKAYIVAKMKAFKDTSPAIAGSR